MAAASSPNVRQSAVADSSRDQYFRDKLKVMESRCDQLTDTVNQLCSIFDPSDPPESDQSRRSHRSHRSHSRSDVSVIVKRLAAEMKQFQTDLSTLRDEVNGLPIATLNSTDQAPIQAPLSSSQEQEGQLTSGWSEDETRADISSSSGNESAEVDSSSSRLSTPPPDDVEGQLASEGSDKEAGPESSLSSDSSSTPRSSPPDDDVEVLLASEGSDDRVDSPLSEIPEDKVASLERDFGGLGVAATQVESAPTEEANTASPELALATNLQCAGPQPQPVPAPTSSSSHAAAIHPTEPPAEIFVLQLEDLGDQFTQSLARLSAETGFPGKVSIRGLNDDWKHMLPLTPPDGYDLQAVEYRKCAADGVAKLLLPRKPKFTAPSLPDQVQPLSAAEVERYINDIIDDPPTGQISYYVGPIQPSSLDALFPSDIDLSMFPVKSADGITNLYGHFGAKNSGTGFHCEDVRLRSFNCAVAGAKGWVKIDRADTDRFETLLCRVAGCELEDSPEERCDQHGREHNLVISPRRLREEGIKFQIIFAGPGEMVTTEPREYHEVFNLTPCFAIASNYLFPGEKVVVSRPLCERCAFYTISDLEREQSDEPPRKRPSKRKVSSSDGAHASKKPRVSSMLAQAICSEEALQRFVNLIRQWREYDKPIGVEDKLKTKDVWKRQANLRQLASDFKEKTTVSRFGHIVTGAWRAQLIDEKILGGHGEGRHQRITDFIQHTGQDRQGLQNELREPRKWVKICAFKDAGLKGMAAFLPFEDSGALRDLVRMSDNEIDALHKCVRQIANREVLLMGQAFLESISKGKDVPKDLTQMLEL